ncbi:hypothetical protein [Tropicimonas marinistellae]|uniref:hypothetical protein n=1 Tax=Tropicimonas marinistellae TaxID=1739787 RepID=UPI00082A9BBB|nr:hypothetical protein [Tropicimonas marinistellae]
MLLFLRPAVPLMTVVLLGGCAQFPELDAALSEEALSAPQPELSDNRPLLAAAGDGSLDEMDQAALQSRAAALQDRTAGLSEPVIGDADRADIDAAHARLRQAAAIVAPDT